MLVGGIYSLVGDMGECANSSWTIFEGIYGAAYPQWFAGLCSLTQYDRLEMVIIGYSGAFGLSHHSLKYYTWVKFSLWTENYR